MEVQMFQLRIVASRWLRALAVIACLNPISLVASAEIDWRPPAIPGRFITAIEKNLAMPNHALPLESYVRYYSGTIQNNRRMIFGTFILDPERASIKVVSIDKMPHVFDGGCRVVNLKYDVTKKKIVALFCNGLS
jgi:hypothetical protein